MNAKLYRLVFSKRAAMYVPVSEIATGRGGKRRARRNRSAVRLLLIVAATLGNVSLVRAIDVGTVPTAGTVVGGGATINSPLAINGGNRLSIDQTAQKAIINWQSFSIGSGSEVVFNQPGASAATLNRVTGVDPSVLHGAMRAPGHVYLINQNGILFGGGSQINVGSLTASTLDVTDTLFRSGILSGANQDVAVGQAPGAVFANSAGGAAGIVVEMGALIKAANHGQVALYAPTIDNAGRIETPDGQAILAAGEKIYLRSSDDVNLRGLLVEVGNGGAVSNTGHISSERGNITLMGMAVNQNGRVSATTSVSANGSIHLLARDNPVGTGSGKYHPKRAGSVTLGSGSITEILPETASSEASDDSAAFNPSRVEIMGKNIDHQGKIVAPSGEVNIRAIDDPSLIAFGDLGQQPARSAARVNLASGSVIDVSGTEEVLLPMSRRQLQVELRGDELKDFPYQRNGVLRGKKVTVDVERGTSVADVSKQLAAVSRTVAEKTLTGGTVKIQSQGDVVMGKGALIDVSGGRTRYEQGFLSLSRLAAYGRIYGISDAPADIVYDFVLDAAPAFLPSFIEGRAAGTVDVLGHGLVLDGDMVGRADAGIFQRDTPPVGGKLVLRDFSTQSGNFGNPWDADRSHDVRFTTQRSNAGIGTTDPVHGPLLLSTDFIDRGGFSRVDLRRHGNIEVPVDVGIAPGGSFRLTGQSISVSGDIRVPAGEINLTSVAVRDESAGDVLIAPNTLLSTRGMWVNDRPGLLGANTGAALVNGGSIALEAIGNLRLGDFSASHLNPAHVDAGGGGWIQANGQLFRGNGGDVSLSATAQLGLGATVNGLAPGKGGTLKLSTGEDLTIREGAASGYGFLYSMTPADLASPEGLLLPTWIFRDWGFSGFDLGTTGNLRVASGARLDLVASYLEPDPGTYYFAPSGADLFGFSARAALPETRQPASLTLTQDSFDSKLLSVEAGARIAADPGASISLSGTHSIFIDGELSAPAGVIDVAIRKSLSTSDLPFQANQALWLGQNARLSSAGIYKSEPNRFGLRFGKVMDGGSVNLSASRGFVYAAPGSVIDVSGSRAPLDVVTARGIEQRDVSSDAGSIVVKAAEAIYLDGQLRAAAGGAEAAGGALDISMLGRREIPSNSASNLYSNRILAVRSGSDADAPAYLRAFGDELAVSDYGIGILNVTDLQGSGIADLGLGSGNVRYTDIVTSTEVENLGSIRFDGNLDLTLARSLKLDSAQIDTAGHGVKLGAAYARLTNSADEMLSAPAASSGPGSLTVNADQIDVEGVIAIRNADTVELASSGDLRTVGLFDGTKLGGRFLVAKDLVLKADQVYPTTLSRFSVESAAADGTITVLPSGASSPVLSAAGELTLRAANIDVQGTLKAPLGRINLISSVPNGQVRLASGGVVSVSAEGQLIPFGVTQNGKDWVYETSPGFFQLVSASDLEKRVRLEAGSIRMEAGSMVDVSGGGDAFAYEFVPGPGGSQDQLTAAAQRNAGASVPNRFAVLPWLTEGSTPYDTAYAKGYELGAGRAVYLDAGAGLPAGTYLLLPAHYALLPGAFLIEALPGGGNLVPNQQLGLADGTPVVAGYFKVAGTAQRDPGLSGFAVYTREQAMQFSEFRQSYASSFFGADAAANGLPIPRLPGDSGKLTIAAHNNLVLGSDLVTAHAAGSRGAEVDIFAPMLAVLSPGNTLAGYVTLTTDVLNRLNAESLLLGGERTSSGGKRRIAVDTTREVVVANDAAHALAAPEILIAARDKVLVNGGAAIVANGAVADGDAPLEVVGNGALLGVSSRSVSYTRSGNVDRSAGDLVVSPGALVQASGSIILDATRENTFKGQLDFTQPQGNLTLGASRISFGAVPQSTPGLSFDQSALGVFSKVRNIDFKSYSSIDFYGSVALGGLDSAGKPSIESLTLTSAGLQGFGGPADTVNIRAANIEFRNPDVATVPNGATGSGQLVVETERFTVAGGEKSITGFAGVAITAQDEIIGSESGTTRIEGNATLSASRLTGTAKADQTLTASGSLIINPYQRRADAAALQPVDALGAKWRFVGADVVHRGVIDTPAGAVWMKATAGGVTVDSAARILAAGRIVDFSRPDQGLEEALYVSGGSIGLESSQGDIEIRNGALLDVAGTPGGSAGAVSLLAPQGDIRIAQGSLAGGATPLPQRQNISGGRFKYDAARLADFSGLNRLLNSAGFSGARYLQARTGDIVIPGSEMDSGNELNAVRAGIFQLTANAGSITVAGQIDAAGAKGGFIGLYGETGVNLFSTALLDARASDAGKRGGRVELAAGSGALDLQAGGQIDVSSGAGGQAGEVLLRSARSGGGAGSGVNVTRMASQISGAGSVILEATKVYDNISNLAGTGSGSTLSFSAIDADNSAFMGHAAAILSGLGKSGDPVFHLRPGVEVRSAGDLTLSENWDLSSYKYGGEPGMLTLRADGDLLLDGSLSDGFNGALATSSQQPGPSWSYRLVAGAEAGPNPLATRTGAGDVKLMANRLVRTGSGDIDIAAGRNFELGWDGSGINKYSAVVYTAGVPATTTFAATEFQNPVGGNYPVNGGDISIRAGQDVRGAVTPQLISQWLRRKGRFNSNGTLRSGARDNPSWWVDFSRFQQNIGALGGGDVSVQAGRDIDNLSVSIPTTGRLPGASGTLPDASRLLVTGGGDLTVTAGGDLRSGLYYLGLGSGEISVAGNIEAGRKVADTNPNVDAGGFTAFANMPVHTIVALGDATMTMNAGGGVDLETVVNPTVIPHDATVTGGNRTYFFTYGERSAVKLMSTAGDVTLHNNFDSLRSAVEILGISPSYNRIPFAGIEQSNGLFAYAPGLTAGAAQGSIAVKGDMTLFPSAYGHLLLLADQDIRATRTVRDNFGNSIETPVKIRLSDTDPRQLLNPAYLPGGLNVVFKNTYDRLFGNTLSTKYASTPVHLQGSSESGGRPDADIRPLTLVAREGDVDRGEYSSATGFKVYAGNDVLDLSIEGQHLPSSSPAGAQISSVVAGRDVRYSTIRDLITGAQQDNRARIQLGGSGTLEVFSGRDIDLGNSGGIVTIGNRENPSLSFEGAAIRVMSGLNGGVDYSGFMNIYFNPVNRNEAHVTSMVETARQRTGDSTLTLEQAYAWLLSQADPVKRELIFNALFSEIRLAGRAAAHANTQKERNQAYQRGYDAIAALFPGDEHHGDLSLLFSQLKTEAGGGIDILVPGGKVNAGQTTPPADSGSTKGSSDLGILVLDKGDIRAFVDGRGPADARVTGDFAVNESRVFTLRGGDILIWSSDGSIDAGRGSKSTISAPPPILVTDSDGRTFFKVQAVAGSGIRAILTDKSIDPSTVDVDLFAPKGEINAGDAGIGSAGNVTLAAIRVVGADNIQVGGIATGVPAADSGLSGASGVSGLGNATGTEEATKSLLEGIAESEKAAQDMKKALANFKPSFVTVDVLGFGDCDSPAARNSAACQKAEKKPRKAEKVEVTGFGECTTEECRKAQKTRRSPR